MTVRLTSLQRHAIEELQRRDMLWLAGWARDNWSLDKGDVYIDTRCGAPAWLKRLVKAANADTPSARRQAEQERLRRCDGRDAAAVSFLED